MKPRYSIYNPRRNPNRSCIATPAFKRSAPRSLLKYRKPAMNHVSKKHSISDKQPQSSATSAHHSLKARRQLRYRPTVAESSTVENASSCPSSRMSSSVQNEEPPKQEIKDLSFVATSVKGFWRNADEVMAVVTRDDEEYLTVVPLKALAKQNLDLLVDSMAPHLRTDDLGRGVPQYR